MVFFVKKNGVNEHRVGKRTASIKVLGYAAPAIVVSAIELFGILHRHNQPGMNVRGIGGEIPRNRGRLSGLCDAIVFSD